MSRLLRHAPAGLAVFAVGAGIGAGVILLTGGEDPKPPRTTVVVSPSSTTPSSPTPERRRRRRGFVVRGGAASLARVAPGAGVAVAPLGPGRVRTIGALSSGHAWSTMKVPLLVTLVREKGGAGGLSAQERAWAEAALTRSDNAAALSLFGVLERRHGGLVGASRAIEATLRRAGDAGTVVNTRPNPSGFSTFGQTEWTGAAATTFFRALARGCLLGAADTSWVTDLLERVVASQRWGLGAAGLAPGTALAFKGGWGPEDGGPYLVRQTGIVGDRYVVSILARGTPSFDEGTRLVTAAARWVREHVSARRAAARCD